MTPADGTSREHDYEAGLREGRLRALEEIVKNHDERFDHHEQRLRIMERILYTLVGAIALIQLMPALQKFFGV